MRNFYNDEKFFQVILIDTIFVLDVVRAVRAVRAVRDPQVRSMCRVLYRLSKVSDSSFISAQLRR